MTRRSSLLSFSLLLLASFHPLFACDVPNGKAVATPQTIPACSYLEAGIGLNEQSQLGVFSWYVVGFGTVTGAVTDAAISPTGGFVSVPTTLDNVVAVPQVGTDGTDFLVAEYSAGALAYRLVRANGNSSSRVSVANNIGTISGINATSTVVWDGQEYLVFYTEFVKPSEISAVQPRVSMAVISRDGALVSRSVLQDNAYLLTAVRGSGPNAFVFWKHGSDVEGTNVTASASSLLLLKPQVGDASKASAANNGSAIAMAFITTSGVQVLITSPNFGSTTIKTLEGSSPNEIEVVADGSDFLIIRSDGDLSARATRLSGTNFGSTFSLATGDVVSAASNSRGTIVMSSYGCGTIQSQFIARGATTASAPVDLTLKATAQTQPRIVITGSDSHQLTYFEGTALYTESIDSAGNPRARTQLASSASTFATVSMSDGGAAVVWAETNGTLLRFARFDSSGNRVFSDISVPLPATMTISSVSIAEMSDSILVAYQGVMNRHPEVHGVLITGPGLVQQDVLLSNSSDEGNDVTAGTDGLNWMIAWRSGRGGQATIIETPRTDLRSQTRRDITLPSTTTPHITAAGQGNIYWTEQSALDGNFVVHRTNLNGSDSVLANSQQEITTVRFIGGIPYWTTRTQSSVTINAAGGFTGCFDTSSLSGADVEYDIRNGAPGAFVYFDGTQLRVQIAGPQVPPSQSSRHRSVRH